ncbi:peptidylprolyl isomerase [Alphaproteobacteria bacterium]|jgi:peptidyl-prolyl cis-trans isomerase C|nr:peptidylprolyl isomerase [Alphaproteobacteria bacterium]
MVRVALFCMATIISFTLMMAKESAAEVGIQLAQAPLGAKGAAKKIVVARVVGEPIYQQDIIRAFRAMPPRIRRAGLKRHYTKLLETVIVAKMLTIYGRRLKLENDSRVKRELKRAEDALVRDVYLGDLVRKQITEKLLKDKYKVLVKKNKGVEEVRARHVLLQTESKAKEIIKSINTGQNFSALAKKHSIGRTASRGGDLNYFKRDEMVKPFSDAAFALKVGQVTQKPVKSDFGWHVIKLEDRRKRKIPTFQKVKPVIRQKVGEEVSNRVVSDLLTQTKVQRFSFDGKTPRAAPKGPASLPTTPKPAR